MGLITELKESIARVTERLFSDQEQKDIMMYKDQGFEATDELLSNLVQYKISPQQDQWLDIWSAAKAASDL
jgi:hypothetical protein